MMLLMLRLGNCTICMIQGSLPELDAARCTASIVTAGQDLNDLIYLIYLTYLIYLFDVCTVCAQSSFL